MWSAGRISPTLHGGRCPTNRLPPYAASAGQPSGSQTSAPPAAPPAHHEPLEGQRRESAHIPRSGVIQDSHVRRGGRNHAFRRGWSIATAPAGDGSRACPASCTPPLNPDFPQLARLRVPTDGYPNDNPCRSKSTPPECVWPPSPAQLSNRQTLQRCSGVE